MDYRDYKGLMERYYELDRTDFGGIAAKEELIRRLREVSREKKQIQTQNKAIIKEYVEKYEQAPELLDGEVEKMLTDFSGMLITDSGNFLDTSVLFRLSRLLMMYYRRMGEAEKTVRMLERCTVFEIIIKEHLDDYEGSIYARMADQYLADFDGMSPAARSSLCNCLLLSVINRKDMTYGLRRYGELRESLGEIRRKMGGDFLAVQFIMAKLSVLGFSMEACRRREYALKQGLPEPEPFPDPERDGPLLEELCGELQAVLASENVGNLVSDRVLLGLYCVQARYHLGKISLEELLERTEEYSCKHEDYNAVEQCTALFTANAYYMDYLCKCSPYEDQYVLDKSIEIVEKVLAATKEVEGLLGDYYTNSRLLMLVNSASNIVDFDYFKGIVLNATVYANKALYVHTMVVKEICHVIVEYILEHDPEYLDGVGGYSWEYCSAHRQEIADLMESCALFHDIGKYFCLDYVSNSSRNLTDEEFTVIKAHPSNFSKVYQGKMTPEVICIHDCALFHHLWHDGKGGYPSGRHTNNQPFVDILSIADSIDAATDNLGRPYGTGKTFAQLVEEFDTMAGTRYSSYICGLLHVEEVRGEIEYIISGRREDIYCEIYLASSGACILSEMGV